MRFEFRVFNDTVTIAKYTRDLLVDTKEGMAHFKPDWSSGSFWLRLTKRGTSYRGEFSTDGQHYETVSERP